MTERSEKRNGANSGWELVETRERFRNNILTLREDEVRIDGAKSTRYAYLERAEAVIVVAVTVAGAVVLLNQYRYPVDEWCLEVPAGGTHDTGGAALEEVVRKELREEIGATFKSLTYVTFFFSANSLTDEKCHVFLAEGVELSKEPEREATEKIRMQLVAASEAIELARSGEMKTAPCALALLLCENLLRERGYCDSAE